MEIYNCSYIESCVRCVLYTASLPPELCKTCHLFSIYKELKVQAKPESNEVLCTAVEDGCAFDFVYDLADMSYTVRVDKDLTCPSDVTVIISFVIGVILLMWLVLLLGFELPRKLRGKRFRSR